MRATVILFKDSGKYYTQEEWTIPENAIGPYDMERSPDFRRIGGGAVLIETQEPWGFPHLFPNAEPRPLIGVGTWDAYKNVIGKDAPGTCHLVGCPNKGVHPPHDPPRLRR